MHYTRHLITLPPSFGLYLICFVFRPLFLAKHETLVYLHSHRLEPPHSGGDSHRGIQKPLHFFAEMPHHSRGEAARPVSNSIWWSNPIIRANLFRMPGRVIAHAPRALYCAPTRYAPIPHQRESEPHRPPPSTTATPKETAPCISDSAGVNAHFEKWNGRFLSGFCPLGRGGAQMRTAQIASM